VAGPSTGVVSGERRLAQTDLSARIDHIASGLAAFGVGPGDCVAILMRNDIAFLEATYAAQRLGAYAVPINWHFKGAEIDYILGDCAAKVLLGHADLLALIRHELPPTLAVVAVTTPREVALAYGFEPVHATSIAGAHDYEDWLTQFPPYSGPVVVPPQTMFYTSGTTGHPKGVRRKTPTPAEQVVVEANRLVVMGTKPGIRGAVPGPLYHSAPNAFTVRGARTADVMVLMPRFDPEGLLAIIERERIDTMFMVPVMFVRLLKLPAEIRRRYNLSSLRFVVVAAAPCPIEVKRAMIEWWGPVINEFYGSTESSAVTFATSADALARPGTVGKTVPGAELRILDDHGCELPMGGVGEIFSRIANFPDFTYHNRPDERARVDKDGFVTSGDVGYLDEDGYLFICDRKRDMVISGGVNIYPAEIEATLLALSGVKDCAVFGVPDAEFGETLMAVVEPADGHGITPDGIRAYLVGQLAGYKVPRRIEVQRDLPREDSGKIFKRRLRDPYWQDAARKI
jgi:long-chain acyl-CoA synthetase